MTEYFAYYDSPIGPLEIKSDEESIISIEFPKDEDNEKGKKTDSTGKPSSTSSRSPARHPLPPVPVLQHCIKQLDEYFRGKRTTFDLPLSLHGTLFQTTVWGQLRKIGFAETLSYKEMAESIDNPKAVRAVGSANGKNPISIIIPCHRVISNDGSLGGYGGGLWRKEWLLAHEKKVQKKH